MWDCEDCQSDADHEHPGAYAHRSAEGRAEIADDQESRDSGDLVGDYHPSRLATGQAKPTLYR